MRDLFGNSVDVQGNPFLPSLGNPFSTRDAIDLTAPTYALAPQRTYKIQSMTCADLTIAHVGLELSQLPLFGRCRSSTGNDRQSANCLSDSSRNYPQQSTYFSQAVRHCLAQGQPLTGNQLSRKLTLWTDMSSSDWLSFSIVGGRGTLPDKAPC